MMKGISVTPPSRKCFVVAKCLSYLVCPNVPIEDNVVEWSMLSDEDDKP